MELKLSQQLDMNRIPQHIAIIMDGNGRWAKEQGQDRFHGHIHGVESVRNVLKESMRLGVKMMTLYTFSEENWRRPKEEVESLMSLLSKVIHDELAELKAESVRLLIIGDINDLPKESREALEFGVEETKDNDGLTLILAINYSGRTEIVRAAKRLQNSHDEITEESFRRELYHDLPDPDLLIRTGGEQRISNFLLWQMAYTELYFTSVYWPAFDEHELHKAIYDYQNRQRRFGMTGDQIEALKEVNN